MHHRHDIAAFNEFSFGRIELAPLPAVAGIWRNALDVLMPHEELDEHCVPPASDLVYGVQSTILSARWHRLAFACQLRVPSR